MKHHTHHLEVQHENGFERYLVFTEKLSYLPVYATRLNGVDVEELSFDDRSRYNDVRAAIIASNYTDDLDSVYYTPTRPIFEDPYDEFRVHINDTNDVLFNTPINLMLVASCTKQVSKIYSRRAGNIQVTRHIHGVSIKSFDTYSIDSTRFNSVMNVLSPRSLQFIDMANLVNNVLFTRNMNNGNLTLAYADIYHNNNDENIIEIKDPSPTVTLIRYDQFTGAAVGNMVEVVLSNDVDNPLYFDSMQCNNWLVEILSGCTEHQLIKQST